LVHRLVFTPFTYTYHSSQKEGHSGENAFCLKITVQFPRNLVIGGSQPKLLDELYYFVFSIPVNYNINFTYAQNKFTKFLKRYFLRKKNAAQYNNINLVNILGRKII